MRLLLRFAPFICIILVFGFVLVPNKTDLLRFTALTTGLTGLNGDPGPSGRDGAPLALDAINAAVDIYEYSHHR